MSTLETNDNSNGSKSEEPVSAIKMLQEVFTALNRVTDEMKPRIDGRTVQRAADISGEFFTGVIEGIQGVVISENKKNVSEFCHGFAEGVLGFLSFELPPKK